MPLWGAFGEAWLSHPSRVGSSRAERIQAGQVLNATLLHDTQYRTALSWQNTAYNQPPHPSFYIGDGMATAPRPTVYTP